MRKRTNQCVQKELLFCAALIVSLDLFAAQSMKPGTFIAFGGIISIIALAHKNTVWRQRCTTVLRLLLPIDLVALGYFAAKLYMSQFTDWTFGSYGHFFTFIALALIVGLIFCAMIPPDRNIRDVNPG